MKPSFRMLVLRALQVLLRRQMAADDEVDRDEDAELVRAIDEAIREEESEETP